MDYHLKINDNITVVSNNKNIKNSKSLVRVDEIMSFIFAFECLDYMEFNVKWEESYNVLITKKSKEK